MASNLPPGVTSIPGAETLTTKQTSTPPFSSTFGPPQATKVNRPVEGLGSGIGPGIFDEISGAVGGYNQLADMFGLDAQDAAQAIETAAPSGAGYKSGFTKTDGGRLPGSMLLGYGVNSGPPTYAPPVTLSAPPRPPQVAPQPDIAAMFGSAFLPGGWGSPAFNGAFPTNSDTPLNLPQPAAPSTSHPAPAPSSGGDGGSSIGAMFGDPVTLASGTHSTVGATGTAQDGRYSYVVQPGGAIAKTINPTPVATNDSSYFAGSRQQAQQNTLKALGFHGDGY